MTLIELLKQIRGIESRMLTTEGIPLKMYGKECEVSIKLCGDDCDYWVEVRSSIDHDEKVAIILQMFEDGTNDSIAMDVANRIKQGIIDKACEWLESNAYLYVDDIDQLHESALIGDFRHAMTEIVPPPRKEE